MRTKLSFSNKFFDAELLEDLDVLEISQYGLLINISDEPIIIDAYNTLLPSKSYLLKDFELESKISKAILLTFAFDPARTNPDLNKYCTENWDNNQKRYPNDPTKWVYKILRSPVERIGNLEFNCWFLPSDTASSIHNTHPFPKEFHTQIYGLGIMNKFKEQDDQSLYQRVYMAPGFSHDTFYDKDFNYPWHQYEAVSDCIWLAVVEYK
ncbi:MAG: hypothetical protein JNK26_00390 [Candidatus Doudnabacteria bacterium]|nr:hypothetical protein [Candidatus Doudnabacteria bacterium]